LAAKNCFISGVWSWPAFSLLGFNAFIHLYQADMSFASAASETEYGQIFPTESPLV
jgi:hypothetical protein